MNIDERIKEIENRIDVIEHFTMPGADTILEYKALKSKLKELLQEDGYSQWFKKEKETIEELFGIIFHTLGELQHSTLHLTVIPANSINDAYIKVGDKELNLAFTLKLLSRYGYSCVVHDYNDCSKLEIKLRKGEK